MKYYAHWQVIEAGSVSKSVAGNIYSYGMIHTNWGHAGTVSSKTHREYLVDTELQTFVNI